MEVKVPGLYRPEYVPEDPDLVRRLPPASVESFEQARQRAAERLAAEQDQREAGISPFESGVDGGTGHSRRPLTFEEAVAIEAEKNQLIAEIRATRARIAGVKDKIGKQVQGGNTVLEFDVDVSKKFRLRNALARAFGVNFFGKQAGTITYEMYLAALDARRQLEQKEADDYTGGNWEEPEGDS